MSATRPVDRVVELPDRRVATTGAARRGSVAKTQIGIAVNRRIQVEAITSLVGELARIDFRVEEQGSARQSEARLVDQCGGQG